MSESGPAGCDASRWEDPVWLATATAWIRARLAELGLTSTGPVEQPHVRPWSTVLRVPTAAGPVWFKANGAPYAHEAALVQRLSGTHPDLVPPLLAGDESTGWMLMTDAGATLRTVTDEPAWLAGWREVLPSYAALQVAWAGRVDELLACGVPDRRLDTLVEGYQELADTIGAERRVHDAATQVAALVDEVGSAGIPEGVQHDDLHDAQIFGAAGSYRILDWGDACVSHPFFTLSVSLQGVLVWGLSDEPDAVDPGPYLAAYLEPFRAAYGGAVTGIVPAAMRLGWACRAVNGYQPGEEQRTRARLGMFLDGRPA